jgi:hypothetical protein
MTVSIRPRYKHFSHRLNHLQRFLKTGGNAISYPDITTAAIEGPEAVGNKLIYRLTRAIGSKG